MIKIIVPTRAEKNTLCFESRYLHDLTNLREHDYDALNTLMHLHMLPDEAWVIEDEVKVPTTRVPVDDYCDEADD